MVRLRILGAILVLAVLGPTEIPAGPASTARVPVWVAVEEAGALVKVDVRTGDVLRRVRTGGGPHNITVAPDGTVAAALYASDAIAIVRNGHLKRIQLGGRPHDVKVAGNLFVVTNEGAARLDLVSLSGQRRGQIPLVANPHDVAIEPGGRRAWTTLDGNDRLAIVNLVKRTVRYIPTGRSPHDLLFSPAGRLYVTDWNGAVHVFDPNGNLIATRPLGEEAHHLAFIPDGRQVWITDHGLHRVFVLRTGTLRIIDRISLAGAPHHVTISPGGRLAVVANHTGGSLLVFSTETRRRVRTIRVGAGPHGVWAVPD